MIRRKLLTAVAAAGISAVALAVAASPASAEIKALLVTTIDGRQYSVLVDVPPGTPLEQVVIPGLTQPIAKVEELPPNSTTTPTPTPTPAPAEGQKDADGSFGEDPGDGEAKGGVDKKAKKDRLESDASRERKAKRKAPDDSQAQVEPAPDAGAGLPTRGPSAVGVPNFFIEKFRIPPFLLPIYQAAGIQYGVRWEVLAAINEIETDYGRNLNISSAGALGWMQFMPATWKAYGVDANEDGVKDPYNPVDAIFAAARYLRAARADKDIRGAVFAYNHADWYVDSVLLRARVIGGLPANLIGPLTGLTQGRFPVYGRSVYSGSLNARERKGRKARRGQNAAYVVPSRTSREAIKIFAKQGSPAVAVNDGRIVRVGQNRRLGRFVRLQDVYGNTYTYGHLAAVSRTYPAPRPKKVSKAQIARELARPATDRRPSEAASATTRAEARRASRARARSPEKRNATRTATSRAEATPATRTRATARAAAATAGKQRLFAHPSRPNAARHGGTRQVLQSADRSTAPVPFGTSLDRDDIVIKALEPGARVVAGTVLGRIGRATASASASAQPHLLFELRPAGQGAPRIDPKPILDGWKLLESTALYRAAGEDPFADPAAGDPSIGQVLLMSKAALQERVLANPRIGVYECGRRDIAAGSIDRRVLATLEYLAASGFEPTVSSLRCGHGYYTASGNVSQHSSGNAVDISAINGIAINGHQGKGSITELTIQRILTLQGTLKPDQIISLMTFAGADNTLAMSDHGDHIHVGWRPLFGANGRAARQVSAILKPRQWTKLISQLDEIRNPSVRLQPSPYAVGTTKPARSRRGG